MDLAIGPIQNGFHFRINCCGLFLAVILRGCQRGIQKQPPPIFLKGAESQPCAHAVCSDHAAGDVRRFLQIVLGASRDILEDDLLRHPPAKQHTQTTLQLRACHQVAVFRGQLLGIAQGGHATRNDRHLANRVAMRQRLRRQRVADFVVGNNAFLTRRDNPILFL